MFNLLNEGKRDEALSMFLPLFQKRGIQTNVSQLKQFLLNKFVTEAGIHSLSKGSNFYLLGVAKYYFNGDLTDNVRVNALYPKFKDRFIPDVCRKLDIIIDILRNKYIDSVGTKFALPEDFGKLSIESLFRKYQKSIEKESEKEEKPNLNASQSTKVNGKYTYEIIYDYEQAKKYKEYTTPGAWCITYGKQHYDGYIKMLKIHYVIFRQNGFERIPRKKGPNWTKDKPQDTYGNSLIAVLQSNINGEPVYITSRWNHGTLSDNTSCEADHAYTKEEFFTVTGCNDALLQKIFEEWNTNYKLYRKNHSSDRKVANMEKLDVLRQFKYAQMLLNGGANLKDVVKDCYPIRDGKNFNGTYIVSLKKDGDPWFTLMDRKKMFYDTFLMKNSFTIGHKGTNYTALSKNEIYANVNSYYIFDHIHHQFVDLEGHSMFTYVSWNIKDEYFKGDYKFAVIALSENQMALLDLVSMKPIRAKNGSCWFESITEVGARSINAGIGRSVNLPYMYGGEILEMVYDSAAGQKYYFNTNTNNFIDTSDEDGFRVYGCINLGDESYLEYFKGYRDGMKYWTLDKLKNINTNEWLVVNGYDTFKHVKIDKSKVIGYIGYDEDVAHYVDMTTWKMLMIEGKPIETRTISFFNVNNYCAISLSRDEVGKTWEKIVLFNPINRTIYHDNISGWYFHIVSSRGVAYYPNGYNKLYNLPSPDEAAKMASEQKANITNQFNDMVNRMNR